MRDLNMGKPNKILMVTTFRHYFIGLGLALNDRACNYHLIFINQHFDDERNPIYQASLSLLEPFASVSCLPIRVSGLMNKKKMRKEAFGMLRAKIAELKPVEIATGNDRRLEFQYAMYFARRILKLTVKGGFLDNGNGSYISYESLNLRKYLVRLWVDVPIKKLIYGSWFTKGVLYGDSHWIDTCYLCHPFQAPKKLNEKEIVEVKVDNYKGPYPEDNLNKLVALLGLDSQDGERGRSILITLPRIKMIADIYGSVERAKEMFDEVCEGYQDIYIKYHPADLGDVLDMSEKAKVITPALPVEVLFSVMRFDCVVGDVSTAIMAAKWMLPESDVYFIDTGSAYSRSISELYLDMGIESLPFKSVGEAVV